MKPGLLDTGEKLAVRVDVAVSRRSALGRRGSYWDAERGWVLARGERSKAAARAESAAGIAFLLDAGEPVVTGPTAEGWVGVAFATPNGWVLRVHGRSGCTHLIGRVSRTQAHNQLDAWIRGYETAAEVTTTHGNETK